MEAPMAIDRERARQCLKAFDFRRLFLDQLGWDKHTGLLEKNVDGRVHRFQAVSEKRGVVVLVADSIPDYSTRVKLDKLIAKDHFEHLIIFTDQSRGRQVWQWMRREAGKPNAIRAYTYSTGQTGELLLQKLEHLVVTLEDEEKTGLADILGRMRTGFDVEKVTKKFYERFKAEHERFLKFIDGIPDKQMESWYASVMINRLMFLYFIQAKSFLNADLDYLRNKLKESRDRKKDGYYRDFLCPLFFEGFARKKEERSPAVNKLLGNVPYLNGGLFQRHQIEELHGKKIQIADSAFEHLFSFFKEYNWHLDERENRDDREINPDVLGYIFEKYINQKQMGAYYTKEDITEYISKNTIIPFLLDAVRKECRIAFDRQTGIWRLLREDPDRYIYEAVRHGTQLELPDEIAIGLNSIPDRGGWKRTAPPEYGLPTEIWREVVERRRRYQETRTKLANGEVREVNDLITLNLDIRQFAQDVIQYCEGPELLRALYRAIEKVSVLDPTCGSGAFLFSALNILKPLYEACLQRMQMFIDELDAGGPHHPKKFEDLREILDQSKKHPNQDYFILKSIIVNNLYGVDIMEEAVEICKLRLFLKLVAQVESQDRIEPLPDIDFNIRAGNTLVGYARYADVQKAVGCKLDFEDSMGRIEDKAKQLDAAVAQFRLQQTRLNGTVTTEDKARLRARFVELEDELNDFLAAQYAVRKSCIESWKSTHKPLHWFSDFHSNMIAGGFDVIIGNPPYVEYRKVRGNYRIQEDQYSSLGAANLYAFCMERCASLLGSASRFGMIVPAGVLGLDDSVGLRSKLTKIFTYVAASTYSIRPSKLFDGVDQRLCIFLGSTSGTVPHLFSSKYHHWNSDERSALFSLVSYWDTSMNRLGRIPQLGSSTADAILTKLEAKSSRVIANSYSRRGDCVLHYHRSPRYWIRAMEFEPYFKSSTRDRSIHHIRDIYFADKETASVIGAILNSSLFFFWFIAVGNGRNITGTDVESFPTGVITEKLKSEAVPLFTQLMKDYQRDSIIRERQDCEFQEFRPSLAKSTIDKIDLALARHYSFTDEELDFITNYDIKYRLGADVDEE
jgi:hypothetical protein